MTVHFLSYPARPSGDGSGTPAAELRPVRGRSPLRRTLIRRPWIHAVRRRVVNDVAGVVIGAGRDPTGERRDEPILIGSSQDANLPLRPLRPRRDVLGASLSLVRRPARLRRGEQRTIRVLEPTADPAVFRIDGHDGPVWRCLNSAWGCNWTLPAASDTTWCRSCRLTRGRPDEARPDAVEAWMTAEAAKRRLVHQLDELALPIEIRSTFGTGRVGVRPGPPPG